jgi:Surface-adhesin protein E
LPGYGVSFWKKWDAMKKLILTLMLALLCTNAIAGWTPIGDGRDFPVTYYLDFKTVHRQRQYVYVWELMDFDTPQEFNGAAWKYLSSKLQVEFDCIKKESRILVFYLYEGNMASTKIVYSASFPSAPWEAVPSDSVAKDLWNSACVKM